MRIKNIIIYLTTFWLKTNLHPIWLFVILFSIAMSKSTIILSSFLPPASIILFISISAILSKLNIILIWLAITLGATIGSIISYHLGNQITNKKFFNRFFNYYQPIINNSRDKLQNRGITVLFTSRFIAILRYITPLVAGILLINRTKVYSICLLSAAIWAITFILIVQSILTFTTLKTLM